MGFADNLALTRALTPATLAYRELTPDSRYLPAFQWNARKATLHKLTAEFQELNVIICKQVP